MFDTSSSSMRRGVNAGVRVGWLKEFVRGHSTAGMTTRDVVEKIIRPETKDSLCR